MAGQSGQPEGRDGASLPMKEWLVEYYVERAQKETMHCLNGLRGRRAGEVQARMYFELWGNFPIEVMVGGTVNRTIPPLF